MAHAQSVKNQESRNPEIYSMRNPLCACAIITLCACAILYAHAPYFVKSVLKTKAEIDVVFGNRNNFLEIEMEIVFWKSKSKSFFGNRFLEIEIEIDFGNRNRNRFLEIVFSLEIEIEIDFGNRNFGNRNRNWKSFFLEPKSIMPTSDSALILPS